MNNTITIQARSSRVSVGAFFFVSGITFSTWASRIPDIKNTLHLSDAGLGLVLFALPAGQLIGLPVSAWLSSKLGSRSLLLMSSLLCPLTLLLLGLVSSPLQLVFGLLIFGLWGNMLNIAMNTQAIGTESIYGRSIMASFHGLWSLAAFTGAVLGNYFVSKGFGPFIHFSILFALISVMVLISFKNILPDEVPVKNTDQKFSKKDLDIVIPGLIAFCCMFCEGTMADWSGIYFQKVVEAPAKYITIGYIAFTATMALGRFISDRLITVLGRTRILQVSGILISAGLLISVMLPTFLFATLGFLLVGFGVSSVVPAVYGHVGKASKMKTSTALAAVSSIGFLGFLAGPPVIGFISQGAGLQISFGIVAALGIGITFLAARIKVTS